MARVRAAVTFRGAAANRRRQRFLLKAGEVRKDEFEVDRAVNFHHLFLLVKKCRTFLSGLRGCLFHCHAALFRRVPLSQSIRGQQPADLFHQLRQFLIPSEGKSFVLFTDET